MSKKKKLNKTQEVIDAINDDIEEKPEYNFNKVISTGSTLLDLEISGNVVRGGGLPGGIVIEIFGPSGVGKCITGESLIYIDNSLQEIKKYTRNKKGFSELKTNILSKDKVRKTSHFFEEDVFKTIEIKNELGMNIEGTPKHPILTINKNCNLVFKKLTEITKNDFTVIPRGMNYFPQKELSINFKQIKKTNANIINIPKKITEDITSLLGYLIANGSGGKNNLRFSSLNKLIIKDINKILIKLNIKELSIDKKDHSVGGRIFRRFVSYLIDNDIFVTARYKSIPDCVLKSPKKHQIKFIKSLFDCDAWITNSRIQYSTASKKLANQVQLLLLNLGVISFKKSKYLKQYNHTYWTIDIFSFEVDKYLNIIGSLKTDYIKINRNTNKDIIPYLKKYIKSEVNKIKNDFNWTKNGYITYKQKKYRFTIGNILHSNDSKKLTHKSIEKFIIDLKKMPQEMSQVKHLLLICEQFNNKKYYFSKVNDINIKIGKKTVYDFTVPKTHNFFSNGFFSHNTALLSEIAASAQKNDGDVRFDDPEGRLNKEYAKIYGMKIAKENYNRPDTVKEMFDGLWAWNPKNKDVINVSCEDSLAALSTEMEMEESDKMGMKRAKDFSEGFRKTCRLIANNNWLIACTNQERDGKNGATTPGGKAVPYYSSVRIRITPAFPISKIIKTKMINGKKQEKTIGIKCKCEIKKNSLDEPFGQVQIFIIFNYGIDDIRGNLTYIKECSGNKTFICPDGQEFGANQIDKAINYIEENNLEKDLKEDVIDLWHSIKDSFKINRKEKNR